MISGTGSYIKTIQDSQGIAKARITRKGSFEYINLRQGFKIISSVSGDTSPYQDGKPVHILTVYHKDTSLDKTSDSITITKEQTEHIAEIHLDPKDTEPATYKPHSHVRTPTQELLFDTLQINQKRGALKENFVLLGRLRKAIKSLTIEGSS